jgi:hypothetical protein
MSKHKKTRVFPDWLRADDALAENGELRREVERAYRNGYFQGFWTASEAAFDGEEGATRHQLLKVSDAVFDWKHSVDAEEAPTYGTPWEPAPTERDRRIDGLLEDLEVDRAL